MGTQPKVVVAARIPKRLNQQISKIARRERRKLSEIITFAVEKYIADYWKKEFGK
jgi:metal-responsive CopG/Arc/MetJ family transcriptional regulator